VYRHTGRELPVKPDTSTVALCELWLSEKIPVPELLAMLEPAPSEDLKAYDVSSKVNRASTNTAEALEPV
jgi:putative SOS response-associated peptidase YedK